MSTGLVDIGAPPKKPTTMRAPRTYEIVGVLLGQPVIAFLAQPVYRAVHDFVRHSGSSTIGVVRLASLVVIVILVGISVGFGGDVAEVGIFMVPAVRRARRPSCSRPGP